MRFNGSWILCDDGVTRPFITLNAVDANGTLVPARFLIDTGADQTLLSFALADKLGLPALPAPEGMTLSGIGGAASFTYATALLVLESEDGTRLRFQNEYPIMPGGSLLDGNILGRNIMRYFHLVASQIESEVCLLATGHRYRIEAV